MTAPVFEEASAIARRRALRHLVAKPLLLARRDPEIFAIVVRHRGELARWFAENTGWTLLVDAAAGHARLLKRPARPDPTRPARVSGKEPFDRRRYTLLCLALAALEGEPGQVTLARIAEAVRESSLEEPELRPFDPDLHAERRAFVDVLQLLTELGVLVMRDGDVEQYARSRDGDALYDVQERLLGQLLAAPRPPSLAGTPEQMREEELGETDEGLRIRARQEVFRRLLDDPVLYLDEVDERTRSWLSGGSGFVYERLLRDVGLSVERRAEGLAAIDPDGTLTDVIFPDGNSTVKHAALLLCEWLAERARRQRGTGDAAMGAATHDEIVACVAAFRAEYGSRWSREYDAADGGDEALANDALRLLAGFGLATRIGDGWVARAVAARFVPQAGGAGEGTP